MTCGQALLWHLETFLCILSQMKRTGDANCKDAEQRSNSKLLNIIFKQCETVVQSIYLMRRSKAWPLALGA
eukprot:1967881-Pleurochrysis_carterae.AAC.1